MKVVYDKTTKRVLAIGQPPWSNQDEFVNHEIVDTEAELVGDNWYDHLFIDGEFVYDVDTSRPAYLQSQRKSDAESSMRTIPNWAFLSPEEAEQFAFNNITDLDSAKLIVSKMALLLFYLKDATFPQLRD